jgi:hypothetical protein
MEQAARAGARVVKPAAETFWGGYGGSFQDPDGHVWEIVWNPKMTIEEWLAPQTEVSTCRGGGRERCIGRGIADYLWACARG